MNEIEFLRGQINIEQAHLAEVLEHCRAMSGGPADGADAGGQLEGCARYLLYVGARTLSRDRLRCRQFQASDTGGTTGLAPALAAGDILAGLAATLPLRQQLLEDLGLRLRELEAAPAATTLRPELERQARLLLGAGLPERWAALQPLLDRSCAVTQWREAAMIDADSIFEERRLFAASAGLVPP